MRPAWVKHINYVHTVCVGDIFQEVWKRFILKSSFEYDSVDYLNMIIYIDLPSYIPSYQ